MLEYYNSLTQPQLVLFWIAKITTIIFLIQTGLSFFAGEAEIEELEELEEGGFEILTFKNFITFLMVFSWTGILCLEYKVSVFATLFFSSFTGIVMVALMGFIFYFFSKMTHDGTLDINNCIGKKGIVYLKIPADGKGKVTIVVQGSEKEFEATSTDKNEISTGSSIVVNDILNNVLIVQKI